jgi:hypothetical protein
MVARLTFAFPADIFISKLHHSSMEELREGMLTNHLSTDAPVTTPLERRHNANTSVLRSPVLDHIMST